MRFAVRRPGNPDASPRLHGVPRRDVPRRVHVSVGGISAGSTPEGGLALTRLPVHLPACRAALARVVRRYPFHPSGCLLVQSASKQTPPRLQDALVEPCFLADVTARFRQCSFCRSGHFPDLEILYPDHIEPACNVSAYLFHPVSAPILFAHLQSGDAEVNLSAAFRAGTGFGALALQVPQPPPLRCGQTRKVQKFTGREGGGYHHSSVNSHYLAISGCRDRFRNDSECNVPAAGPVSGNSIGFYILRHRTGPSEPQPPNLRHPNLTGLPAEASDIPLPSAPTHYPKPLVPSGLTPRWTTCWVRRVKESRHGPGEISQGLLLYRLRARGEPRVLRARLGELTALLHVTRGTLSAWVPIGVLLNREIPHVPGMRAMRPQSSFLYGRREQSKSRHANTLANGTDIFRGGEAALLCGLTASVPAPRYL